MHYFTADTHFGHARVLQYTDRPYPTIDQMDAAFVDNWNALVRPSDTVYHLPISFDRIKEAMSRKNWRPQDGHGRREG